MTHGRTKKYLAIIGLMVWIFGAAALAQAKSVTDQLGRVVELPDKVSRAVVLEHHALDVIIQIGAKDQVVGTMEKWKEYLPGAIKSMPSLANMPTPGDLKTVNVESLLSLNPDVVIVTHYAPPNMIQQIVDAGVPVVAVSFYRADYEQASTLNPKLKDPDKAYTQGMEDGIKLMGDVFGQAERASKLIQYILKNRKIVQAHLSAVPDDKRVTCYMANPGLNTYGTGKYTGVIMQRAGGRNVAEEINGYQQVSMEQILTWDPEVIFVQDRYQSLIPEIKADPAWKTIKAVVNNRIYLCPEYSKPWGHPCPESMALGEIWMAAKLYPEKFADVDLPALVDDYYRTFYGIPYDGSH